jgi:hypothetical protein
MVRIDNELTSRETLIIARKGQLKNARFLLNFWENYEENKANKECEIYRWKCRIDQLELVIMLLERE